VSPRHPGNRLAIAPTESARSARRARTGPAAIPIATSDTALRALKTSESVARDIVHDIVTRGLQTGDRLPPEASMVELYRVSRESLREGLRLLELQGMITIRTSAGGGPVVGRIEPANLGRMSAL
jgi:DNA-binding FadR family transcriptional regulator